MKKIIALLLAAVMVLGLAACGSGSSNESATTKAAGNESANAETTAAETAGDYKEYTNTNKTAPGEYLGDEIRIAGAKAVSSFDPFARGSSYDGAIVTIFEKLGVLDLDGSLKLILLKSIEKVDDVTYDCELWDFIHDSEGNEIKASDIQYCYEQYIANGENLSGYESIEVTGDYTFTFHCSIPFIKGEYEKAFSDPKIFSQAEYEKGNMANNPVGTGPYVLKENMEGSYGIFEADEDYWYNDIDDAEWLEANDTPYTYQNFKNVRIDVIDDGTARAIALENGEVDACTTMNAADVINYINDPAYVPVNKPEKAPTAFIFNCSENSLCANADLRKAICYAIDNAAIASAMDVPAYAAYGIQPRMFDAPANWMSGEGRDYFNHNEEKVKEYLEKAGYNGETLKVVFGKDTLREAAFVMMQAELRDLGINIELIASEGPSMPKYDFTAWDMLADKFGGGSYLANTLAKWWSVSVSKDLNGLLPMGIEDPKLDELFVAIRDGGSEAEIDAWDDYFTAEQCYGYAIQVYDEQTCCSSKYVPVVGGDRYELVPGAFTLAE